MCKGVKNIFVYIIYTKKMYYPHILSEENKNPNKPDLYVLYSIHNYAKKACNGKTCSDCWH